MATVLRGVVALAFALLVAGCAAGAFDPPAAAPGARPGGAGPTAQPTRDVTVAASGTRVVGHPLGPSRVPVDPRRLWVADARADLDALLALGVQPVGLWGAGAANPVPVYLDALAGEVQVTGDAAAIDVGALARLEPDLLVGPVASLVGRAEALAAVAPLFTHDLPQSEWQFHFRLLADLVGEPLRANQVIADYEDRAAALGDQLGRPSNTVVSVVRVDASGRLTALGRESFAGSVLDEVGLGRPPRQDSGVQAVVTLDQVARTEADLLVLVPTGGEFPDDATIRGLGSPVLVAGEHWASGSALAAGEILDDLLDALVDPRL